MTSIQQRDAQSVLAGIDDLLPRIRERAQATEDLRRLPEETVQELDEVGFFTLLQPEQWGGLQCDPTHGFVEHRRVALQPTPLLGLQQPEEADLLQFAHRGVRQTAQIFGLLGTLPQFRQ